MLFERERAPVVKVGPLSLGAALGATKGMRREATIAVARSLPSPGVVTLGIFLTAMRICMLLR